VSPSVSAAREKIDAHPERKSPLRWLLALNQGFCGIYHRVERYGPWTLPATGPAILVCNHISGLDPLLIQSVSPRLIMWMMAREYYEVPALGWVFKSAETIPVDRSGRDLSATRAAMRALSAGRILGVFPEGKIEPTRDLLPFQTGVAMMAIKTGVPIFPAYIDGTQRNKEMLPAFLIPNRTRLRFGPPIQLDPSASDHHALEQATERVFAGVAELKRQDRD
jgi:1-acyl-sn-glycerol-3-phosphate acyltransferase